MEVFVDQVCYFKLVYMVEICNICIYCLVGCGLIMYSQGDGVKNVVQNIIYIEGDVDYLVNCGIFCLKGVGLLDYIYSLNCLKYLEVCEVGFSEWKCIEWDEVFECIVKLMKEDCDVNFVEKNEQGQIVNCWLIIGFFVVFVLFNEVGYIIYKVMCFFGILGFDNQVCV